jgi:CTP:molybdopterin cytidylyltransferase MocA/NifU-like protein involved in Fe-S cluster formation
MSGGGPYGGAILEHFRRPHNYGALPNAAAEAEGANPLCGDRVRLAIAVDATGEQIDEARFTANACAICVAAASLLTERLRGMTRAAAAELTDDEMLGMLEGHVPAARRRCAVLPVEALRHALASIGPQPGRVTSTSAIAAILLAAGSATRFGGEQKLIAPVPNGDQGTVALVRRSAIALRHAGLDRVLVVLGRGAEMVRDTLTGLDLRFIVNEAFRDGMSTSLTLGIRTVVELWPEFTALLIALGDQPLVDATIIERLVNRLDATPASPIIAPLYRGRRGNPVVFRRELMDELLAIRGDQGAREVVERNPSRVSYLELDSPTPMDIDTPDDLDKFVKALGDHTTR